MNQPVKRPGARFCVVFRAQETVIYGNAAGFSTLADWMTSLADAASPDMCELTMNEKLNASAESREAPFDTVSFIDERDEQALSSSPPRRELTFMVLTDEKLDALRKEAEVRQLPVRTDQEAG